MRAILGFSCFSRSSLLGSLERWTCLLRFEQLLELLEADSHVPPDDPNH
jgi:hypothetical protein